MIEKQLDPRVLGQLLLMQSIVTNLPDRKSIFTFMCHGLKDVPGVKSVEYREQPLNHPVDPHVQVNFSLQLNNNTFGEIGIILSDYHLYEPYKYYLDNFLFMIAVILEERLQRQKIEHHKRELEVKVEERTRELKEKNEEIEAQNEEYQQINEELFQLNQELNMAKEHAEESNKLKTAFLQNMSHEIRTPMNAIMGFADLIKHQINSPEKLEQYATIINQRCKDLLGILNDVLDVSKIESGQLEVHLEQFKLKEIWQDLGTLYAGYQARLNKPGIVFQLPEASKANDLEIVTDKTKLKQILNNLISNALKFTEKGSIEVDYEIVNDHFIRFQVTDSGIGIPSNEQEKIFERFVQINDPALGNTGGTGLGLSIVKGLVQLMGGELQLESTPGKGSTFSFTIPGVVTK